MCWGAACLQTGDLHIQVAENSVMLGALFAGLTVYPQGAQQAANGQLQQQCLAMSMDALHSYSVSLARLSSANASGHT
jgi:hypothetical protein